MERVLLTGSTGFVGANILRRLVTLGDYEIHITTRKNSNLWRIKDIIEDPHVINHVVDLRDYEQLDSVVHQVEPDYILHLATYGAYPTKQIDTETIIQTNFTGTRNLIDTSLDIEYRCFINTGSSSEYGFKKKPMAETDVLEPVNMYGVAKAASCLYSQAISKINNKNIINLRLFSVYGYYEEPIRLIPTVARHIIEGSSLDLTEGKQKRDFIFIDDVIDAYLRIMNNNKNLGGEILNIGTGIQTSVRDVVKLMVELSNSKIKLNFGKKPTRDIETFYWVADINKMKKMLRWEPKYSLEEGLKKTLEWFNENISLYPLTRKTKER